MATRYQRNILIKQLLLPVGMGIVAILLVIYAVIPGIKNSLKTWEKIGEIQKENTLLKKKVNTLSQFDEETLTSYVTTLLTAIPAEKSVASILTTIENVALKNNMSVSDLSVLNPGSISTDSASTKINNTKLGSNTIRISTNVTGSIENANAFIQNIRKVRRLIRVASLSQSFSQSESSPSSKIAIELEAFYAPLPQTLGKIESEVQPLSANEEEIISSIALYPLEYEIFTEGSGQVESGNKIDPFSF